MNQLYLDNKIHLGTEPISIGATSDGKIFVLNKVSIEVYSRAGQLVTKHDSENFSYLSIWRDKLVVGTTESELMILDPETLHVDKIVKSPLSVKT